MTNTPYEIPDKMYNHTYFAWHGKQALFLDWAQEKFGLSTADVTNIYKPNLVGQMVPFLDNKHSLIWIDDKLPMTDGLTYVTIAHEVQHATFHVMRTRGVTYGKKSEEAFTYHSSWLMSEIIQAFAAKKEKKPRGRKPKA